LLTPYLIAKEFNNAEIAREMQISEKTVKNNVYHILSMQYACFKIHSILLEVTLSVIIFYDRKKWNTGDIKREEEVEDIRNITLIFNEIF